MSDTFVMSARQASELDHAFERNNWTPSDVKALSKGDVLAKILPVVRGFGNVATIEQKRLHLVSTITLPARRKKFNPRAIIKTGGNLYRWETFSENSEKILSATSSVRSTPSTTINSFDFTIPLTDDEIRAELGEGHMFPDASIFCAYLDALIDKQKNGEKKEGYLLTNGYANIFYVRGVDSEVFAVRARWLSGDREWGVSAFRLDDGCWGAGNRIFRATATA